MVIDDINNIPNDIDILRMTAQDVNIDTSSSPTNEDEISIQPGHAQPLQMNDDLLVPNSDIIDGQPLESGRHHDEPAVEIPFASNLTYLYIVGFEIPFSSVIQNVTNYNDIPFDITFNSERETVAELVQNDYAAIQVLDRETIPIQTVDSPAQVVPIGDEIDTYPMEHRFMIELTQDNNVNEAPQIQLTTIVSPVTISSTQNDNAAEEVPEVQMTPNTEPHNSNEQIDQPESDSPVASDSQIAARSLEVADPNLIVACKYIYFFDFYGSKLYYFFLAVIDNMNEVTSIDDHIQTPILVLQTHKRSNSSDTNHQADKKSIRRYVQRHRNSVS
ncbi:unnamed protein product [Rotaria sp. Silwood2]|nr:unnamed protein product [Rotaria sp. Silwood2]CAF4340362.1 unnamed protein product [Rotaria sp. Silwood2]